MSIYVFNSDRNLCKRIVRFSAEQMRATAKIADIFCEYEISNQTYYGYLDRFAGTTLTESCMIKELEMESENLNGLVV